MYIYIYLLIKIKKQTNPFLIYLHTHFIFYAQISDEQFFRTTPVIKN